MNNKRQHGQYFTVGNPFTSPVFLSWVKLIDGIENETILEPFCGANNLPATLKKMGWSQNWDTFDIEPSKNSVLPNQIIQQKDVLLDFPVGYKVSITNPPYLAKNSANRRGLGFPETVYDDLYQHCVDKVLSNVEYAAIIIPESFLVQNLFHDRIYAVVSLSGSHFADTEHPVCLALFIPKKSTTDFEIWRNDIKIGNFKSLSIKIPKNIDSKMDISFNDKSGAIGIRCVDNQKESSIVFVRGESISKDSIKQTSRAITRVSCASLPAESVDLFIMVANKILKTYREETSDVFLTAFKGERKDGLYRRRLDFATARNIIKLAVTEVKNIGVNDTNGER